MASGQGYGAFTRSLGEGTYGEVFEATNLRSGEPVAIKRWRDQREFQADLSALKEAVGWEPHPNLVQYLEIIEPQGVGAQGQVVLAFAGRSLGRILEEGAVEPDTALDWVRQVVAGLLALKERSVLLADVKPDNLLIDEGAGVARVGDYSSTQRLRESVKRSMQTLRSGTAFSPGWSPPELLQLEGARRLGERSLVYSVALVLCATLAGENAPPYDVRGDGEIVLWAKVRKILAGRRALKALVNRMLSAKPKDRPTLKQVSARLETIAPPKNEIPAAPVNFFLDPSPRDHSISRAPALKDVRAEAEALLRGWRSRNYYWRKKLQRHQLTLFVWPEGGPTETFRWRFGRWLDPLP